MGVIFNGEERGMGWGPEENHPDETLRTERKKRTILEDRQFFADLSLKVRAAAEETPMEKRVREKFQFDEGWSFHVTEEILYGKALTFNQGNVGTCVGAGGALALAARASHEIILKGDPEDPYGLPSDTDSVMPFIGYHYGCGRLMQYYNGDRFTRSINDGDGSYCSVQIEAYQKTGILPCSAVTTSSRPFPQSSDVRDWGNNKRDLLNQHIKLAQQYLMTDSVTVKSADDLKNTVIVLKQPCHICSGWGFAEKGLDSKYGLILYRPSGSWSHNMTVYAVFAVKGQWFVYIKNSWGASAHPAPGLGLPPGGFVIAIEDFARWIRQAECMGVGELRLPSPDNGGFV